jgi:hypothetical protein
MIDKSTLPAKSLLAKSLLAKSPLAKSLLAKSLLAKSLLAKSPMAKSPMAKSPMAKSLLAAVGLMPTIASAGFILDTGVPDGSTGTFSLSTTSWLAGEFAATAGEDITSLGAYLTQGAGQPGDTFTFDIYSSTNFTGRSTSRVLDYSATGTYTANGWNTAAVNWTPASTGDYWLALQVSSTGQTRGLDAPGEPTVSTTATAPAIAFAYLGPNTEGKYTENGAPAIGLQVGVASAVPLPASFWLLASGLLVGLGSAARRRCGPAR